MCIDIVEILFGIANGQISSNFDGVICLRHVQELSAPDTSIFSFPDDNLSKHQWIVTKLGMYIENCEQVWDC